MYNFTRFDNKGPTKDELISINKSGEITFSSVFCYNNKVFSYGYAVLFWDSEKKAVGIRFTNKKDEKGRYVLNANSKRAGARISAKGFLKSNQIDLDIYAGRYDWKKYEDPYLGTLYVFELEKK